MNDSGIDAGSRVRYPRTGTSGTVVRLKEIEGHIFAEVDSTGLLYRIDQLILLGEEKEAPKRRKRPEKEAILRDETSSEDIMQAYDHVDGVGAG